VVRNNKSPVVFLVKIATFSSLLRVNGRQLQLIMVTTQNGSVNIEFSRNHNFILIDIDLGRFPSSAMAKRREAK
jgi:hypothetical protein